MLEAASSLQNQQGMNTMQLNPLSDRYGDCKACLEKRFRISSVPIGSARQMGMDQNLLFFVDKHPLPAILTLQVSDPYPY